MCNVLLPPGVNPIAVNIYHIISDHIIIYHIIPYLPGQGTSVYSGITIQNLLLKCKDFVRGLVENHQRKCPTTRGITCSVRLVFVKAQDPVSDHSLKLRWMKFECVLYAVQTSDKRVRTIDSAQNGQVVWAYQMMQHATTQDKEVTYTFCCDVLWKLEGDETWRRKCA
jgi:hypothetical protein